jgi:hypothetical protein
MCYARCAARLPRLSYGSPWGGLLLVVPVGLPGLCQQHRWLAIMCAGVQEGPGDPRHLLGDSHPGLINPNPRHQLPHPCALSSEFVPDMADNRACPMHQQPSDITMPTLGDPTSTRRPAAAMLARHQTQPRRHLPARCIGLRNYCGSSKSIRTGAGPFHYDPHMGVKFKSET